MKRISILCLGEDTEPEDYRDEDLLSEPGCPSCGHRQFVFVSTSTVVNREEVIAEYDGDHSDDFSTVDYRDSKLEDELDSNSNCDERECTSCGHEYTEGDVDDAMDRYKQVVEEGTDSDSILLSDLELEPMAELLDEHARHANRIRILEHPHLVVFKVDQRSDYQLVRANEPGQSFIRCPGCNEQVAQLDERKVYLTMRDGKNRPVMLVVQECYGCRSKEVS